MPNTKLSEKIGYGFGDMSSSMFWKIFTYYLPFFYSNIFGLTLSEGAMLLLVTKLWDAVFDPCMGIIADRTRTRWGKYRPYLLWMAIPFAVMGVLTFTVPHFTHGWQLFYAYATYILMMTVYSGINVPYAAMLGVVSDDPRERTVFSSFRMFFAFGGSFLALAIFEPIRDLFGGVNSQTAWTLSMLVIGMICAILFFCCFSMTREHVVTLDTVKTDEVTDGQHEVGMKKASIGHDIKSLIFNLPWWILLVASIAAVFFSSIRGGTAAYFFQDCLGNHASLGGGVVLSCGVFLAVGEVANMFGVIFAVPVSNKLGKSHTYLLAMLIAGILSVVFYFLPVTVSGVWGMLILQVLINACCGITYPLLWSMFADIGDWSEWKHGNSSTGLIFSSSSMAQKIGGAIGSALVLWLLSAFGYQAVQGVAQTSGALHGLNLMMSWFPAIACLIAVVAVAFYPLTNKKMEVISAELKERRAKNNSCQD
ncbi:MFS transporter [Prevotella cerevisiae]|uniref:MFS transporter n=1 Tax=Segatella cerevisiae TaxID=2053716 RepID=A0ABT1BZ22_9BACT|nr:MFS transporter [Segatella cerevisiae]MCO6026339.1 MFS transporter [Segatella cerevisiae]